MNLPGSRAHSLPIKVSVASNRIEDHGEFQRCILWHKDQKNNGCRCCLGCDTKFHSGDRGIFSFGIRIHPSWFARTERNFDCLVAQWRQNPGAPTIALHVVGRQWVFKRRIGPRKVERFILGDAIPGLRHNFDFHIQFGTTGRETIWLDGERVHEAEGMTMRDDTIPAHHTVGPYRPQYNKEERHPDDPLHIIVDVYPKAA